MSESPLVLRQNRAPAFHRALRVVALCERGVPAGLASRLGRLYAFLAALGSSALVVYLSVHGERSALGPVIEEALTVISWAAGMVAWSAARPEGPDADAVMAVALVRGVPFTGLGAARGAALAAILARAVGAPMLVLAGTLVLASSSLRNFSFAIALVGGVMSYAVFFAVALAALVRAALLTSRRHAQALLAAFVLVPYAAHEMFGVTPNVVSACAWLIDRIARLSA